MLYVYVIFDAFRRKQRHYESVLNDGSYVNVYDIIFSSLIPQMHKGDIKVR